MAKVYKIAFLFSFLLLVFVYVWMSAKVRGRDNTILALQAGNTNLEQVVKEKDGLYKKTVDNFLKKTKELKEAVEEKDKELAKQIRKNKETILSYEKILLSFEGQIDTVFVVDTVPGTSSFVFNYPDKEDWFIALSGRVKDGYAIGSWEFGNLPLSIIMTEQKDGKWIKRYSGPSWISVENVNIISQPPKEYAPCRTIYFPVGAGYSSFPTGSMISVTGGVSLKKIEILGKGHLLNINGQSHLGYGVELLYRL